MLAQACRSARAGAERGHEPAVAERIGEFACDVAGKFARAIDAGQARPVVGVVAHLAEFEEQQCARALYGLLGCLGEVLLDDADSASADNRGLRQFAQRLTCARPEHGIERIAERLGHVARRERLDRAGHRAVGQRHDARRLVIHALAPVVEVRESGLGAESVNERRNANAGDRSRHGANATGRRSCGSAHRGARCVEFPLLVPLAGLSREVLQVAHEERVVLAGRSHHGHQPLGLRSLERQTLGAAKDVLAGDDASSARRHLAGNERRVQVEVETVDPSRQAARVVRCPVRQFPADALLRLEVVLGQHRKVAVGRDGVCHVGRRAGKVEALGLDHGQPALDLLRRQLRVARMHVGTLGHLVLLGRHVRVVVPDRVQGGLYALSKRLHGRRRRMNRLRLGSPHKRR